jgi:shikimate dehydrogenase
MSRVSEASLSYELGLIGYPLGHSLSPLLHEAALTAAGLDGCYRLYAIPPEPVEADHQIIQLLQKVASGEITGLNVTIPHKQKIIRYLDHLTPVAAHIEAVNTIYRERGEVTGDNTDVPGFLFDLGAKIGSMNHPGGPLWQSSPDIALVLGAGGSARAITYALLSKGVRIVLLSRRIEQAKMIRESLIKRVPTLFQANTPLEIRSLPDLGRVVDDYRDLEFLIINTTPVGMWPDVNNSPWPDQIEFPGNASVYDLIYNPRETLLMRQAKDSGLNAWNGLGMLVEQAAVAFTKWTGVEPVNRFMWEALREIERNQTTEVD